MALSHIAATIQADSLANFFRVKRPDLGLTQSVIMSILQGTAAPASSPSAPGPRRPAPAPASSPDSPALIIAAAWILADHLAQHRGRWKTFGMLPEVITHLQEAADTLARPALAHWPTETAAGEATGATVATCPAHPWAPAKYCSPCYSEIKAGQRPATAYGAETY